LKTKNLKIGKFEDPEMRDMSLQSTMFCRYAVHLQIFKSSNLQAMGGFILFLCFFISARGQQADIPAMDRWQDSLAGLGWAMYNLPGQEERILQNAAFVKTLVSSLRERHSYSYDFRKLDMVSVLRSPHDDFRIFSWHILLNDGSYLYYGAIQSRTTDGRLKLSPLLDKTFAIKNPETEELETDRWYGAQYYDIVPLGRDYVLLGWKGHGSDYSQKVIEILRPENGAFRLGKAVFSDDPKRMRRVFNFAKGVSMHLKWHPKEKQIIFDHIIAAEPEFEGDFRHYGPDLTFDAYEINAGKLRHIVDIPFHDTETGVGTPNIVPGRAIPNRRSGLMP